MRYLFFLLLIFLPIVHVSAQDVVYEFTITSGAKVALNADQIRVATQTTVGCDIVYDNGFDLRSIRTQNTLNQLQSAMCGLGIPVQVVISGVLTSAIVNQSFVYEIVRRTDSQGSIIMQGSKSVYDTRLPYQSVVNLFKNCANAGGTSFTGVSTGPSITGNGLLASPLALAPQGATTGQVLKYNGTAWVPAADATGGTVTTNTTLSGDGTVGNPLKIAQQGAINGQVMRWIGGEWVPSSLPTSVTTVGPSTATPSANGATITGTTINLAKANAFNAGLVQLSGDFGGTATVPRVTGLQGRPISATTPTNGQVYVYNASLGRWEPGTVSGGGGGGGSTDLAVDNRTSTTFDLTSTSGLDATLPFATNLLAGLLIADDKTKLDNITITSPVNLNTLATNSHIPVTVSGETYITLAGQALTANQINSTNIANGTILYADINQNGATTNQSFRWNGSAWVNYATLTSLDVTQGLTNVGLDFNGGTSFGAIILSANASRSGVLTAALWSKLDTLNNQRVVAGTGIGVVKVGQDYTVTNNAPDQTVVITGASGTYPNFTLPTIDGSETKVNSGTNISVTGSGTIASPYAVNNSAPEATTITDGTTINLTKTGNDITAELQQQAAITGQVLKWNGTQWIPQNDNVGSVTTNNLVSTSRTIVTNGTGAILGSLPVTVDVDESGLNPTNIPIADTGGYFSPDNINAALQQLGANNHVPLTVTDGAIIDFTLTGQNLTATIISGSITTTQIADGTIGLADLNQMGAISGQSLRWNGTAWEPFTPSTADGSETKVNSGTSISVTGLGTIASPYVINNTAPNIVETATATPATAVAPLVGTNVQAQLNELGAKTHDAVTVTDNAKINFTLTGQDITANIITGSVTNTDLAASGAVTNQVLAFNGTNWVPTTPSSGITDLSVANRTTTTLDVLSSTGTDATIPAATNLLAGLMISADKAKSDFITVTQAVDLDVIESSSHSAVTVSGENYISLTGQAITVNAVDISGSNITGILKTASVPAFSGAITNTAGSLVTTLSNNVVGGANIINNSILGTDIATMGANVGEVLTFIGAGEWDAVLPAGDVGGSIANLQLGTGVVGTNEIANNSILFQDFAVNGAVTGNVISYNGSAWVPSAPAATGLTGLTAGDGISITGISPVLTVTNTGLLSELDGTTIDFTTTTGVLTGEVKTNSIDSTHIKIGGVELEGLSQDGATTGQVLTYNGSTWSPGAIGSGSISWPLVAPDSSTPNYGFSSNVNNGIYSNGTQLTIRGEGVALKTTDVLTGSPQTMSIQGGNGIVKGGTLRFLAGYGENEGGNFELRGGDSENFTAGELYVSAGNSINGNGGSATILGGNSESGNGGSFTMSGGQTTNGDGGGFILTGGSGTQRGGNITINAGFGGTFGGNFFMSGGDGESEKGGSFFMRGGVSTGNDGGNFEVDGGTSDAGKGGDIIFRSGVGVTDEGKIKFESLQNSPAIFNTGGIQYKSLTTTQRDALSGVTGGRVLYNGTLQKLQYYNGTAWKTPLTEVISSDITWPLLAPTTTIFGQNYGFQDTTGGMYWNGSAVNITGPALNIRTESVSGGASVGSLLITGGQGGSSGGLVQLSGGYGPNTGGDVILAGGESDDIGGSFFMQGGFSTAATGGNCTMAGGNTDGDTGGNIFLLGGSGAAQGGNINITTGSGGNEGIVTIESQSNPLVTNTAGIQYKSLTTTQRDALTGLTAGRLLWNSTLSRFNQHDGTSWFEIPKSNDLTSGGNRLVFANSAGVQDETSIDPVNVLVTGSAFGGDVSGTYDNLQLEMSVVGNSQLINNAVTTDKIQNNTILLEDIAQNGATTNQVMTWNGSAWVPQNPGSGADNWGSQVVITDATLTGNGTAGSPLTVVNSHAPVTLAGENYLSIAGQLITANQISSANITNGTITGTDIATGTVTTDNILNGTIGLVDLGQMGATTNQVLRWNSLAWEPYTPTVGTLTGLTNGGGVAISGSAPNLTLTATDALVTNEGVLSVAAGTGTTAQIVSNTSGSSAINLSAGTGMAITENIGSSTITLTNTGVVTILDGTTVNLSLASQQLTAEVFTNSIDSTHIKSDAVKTIHIVDDAITQAKIANDAVGSAQIANSAVGSTEIINGSVGALDLASQSAATGQVLTYGGVGIGWIPDTPSGGGSLPTGTSTQTLRYDATNTLVSTNVITNDGTSVGIGGAPASDMLTVTGTTKSLGALKVEGTGLNAGTWITNTTASNTWYTLQESTGSLYFQTSTGGFIPLTLDSNRVEVNNIVIKDAIFTDVVNVASDPTIYQVTGIESTIELATGTSLTTINLPQIVTGTPGSNQVNKNFTLTLIIKSPNDVTINRAGADLLIQHGTTGTYTSFPIAANTTAVLQLIALKPDLWSIK